MHVQRSLALFAALAAPHGFAQEAEKPMHSPELQPPVRLEANGQPIDIAQLSSAAHAGPAHADVDGDGDRDLLVGDFPGHFWYFENRGDDAEPRFFERGKLAAGRIDAKIPVY